MSNENSSQQHSSSHHHHSSHSSYSQPYGYGVSSGSHNYKSRKRNISSGKKNKRGMKKGNKLKLIIAIIICILILAAIAGYEIYHSLILPNYVKPVLEDVVTIMQDEKYTSGITREIQRLYDLGQISGPEVEKYLELHSGTPDTDTENPSEEIADPEPNTPQSNSDTDSLGITSVNVIDEGSSGGSSTVHYYSNGSSTRKPTNTVSMKELQTLSSDELYAKAKSIMSAEDFATAMSLRPKVNASKVKQLHTNPSELIAYLQTVLTTDEYSNMLYIYAKYSNHLTN